jgi:hypothetical protein
LQALLALLLTRIALFPFLRCFAPLLPRRCPRFAALSIRLPGLRRVATVLSRLPGGGALGRLRLRARPGLRTGSNAVRPPCRRM